VGPSSIFLDEMSSIVSSWNMEGCQNFHPNTTLHKLKFNKTNH
jgi:hypothetical protein